MTARPDRRRIAFVSSNDVWGGSEELWSLAALRLARAGVAVSAFKPRIDPTEPRVLELRAAGCTLTDLFGSSMIPRKVRTGISLIWTLSRRMIERRIASALRRRRPDLVVISQGLNHDGWYVGILCQRLGVPYVFVSQKASDLYWPHDNRRAELALSYRHAVEAYFVSEHNRRLTEEQIGERIAGARLVRNPFNIADPLDPAWPQETGSVRLACVARLDAREKGQDLLLRVLALPKWRERPLSITFVGSGQNAEGLRGMAALLELRSVTFAGYTNAPSEVWRTHHGLILPSRCEGLPLSVIEAMLSHRIVITTAVGGNAEMVSDGRDGFVAPAATEEAIDHALDRAWARRADWPAIAAAGAARALASVGKDPVGDFAALLLDRVTQLRSA